MTALLTVGCAAAGAGIGVASGWLAVELERRERLEAEEAEERDAFLAEERERVAAAVAAGDGAAVMAEWAPERYGWTWLERFASPLLGAVGFAAFAAHDGAGRGLLIHLFWVTAFLHITLFDVKHRLILNRVVYPLIAVAIALTPVSPGVDLRTGLIGAAAVGLFFTVQSVLFGGSVLGLGDAKLGVVVGATTGLGTDLDHLGAVDAVVAAVLSAGAVALLLVVTRVRGLKDPIPYGPFLCAGAALIIYHGASGP